MNAGCRREAFALSESDRIRLESMLRKRTLAQSIAARIRIVLLCAQNMPDAHVAARLGIMPPTVAKWRKRYTERGLEGLLDAPRSGAPRTITDEHIERVLRLTAEGVPAGAKAWSTRSMAKHCGISQSSVFRILRAHGVK